jgi:hypothetical protein
MGVPCSASEVAVIVGHDFCFQFLEQVILPTLGNWLVYLALVIKLEEGFELVVLVLVFPNAKVCEEGFGVGPFSPIGIVVLGIPNDGLEESHLLLDEGFQFRGLDLLLGSSGGRGTNCLPGRDRTVLPRATGNVPRARNQIALSRTTSLGCNLARGGNRMAENLTKEAERPSERSPGQCGEVSNHSNKVPEDAAEDGEGGVDEESSGLEEVVGPVGNKTSEVSNHNLDSPDSQRSNNVDSAAPDYCLGEDLFEGSGGGVHKSLVVVGLSADEAVQEVGADADIGDGLDSLVHGSDWIRLRELVEIRVFCRLSNN